ncbi:DUF6225 family protein [Streptomyces sp. NPDC057302]|uniref:DUF6225 family protein n=1 Tax=Streptomyces sp. NPDC057302 TaxID=3346094 RepID=UPI00362F0AAC
MPDHVLDVWTAGRLHDVIKDLPDDASVYLTDYEPAELLWGATKRTLERAEVQRTLFADCSAGTYDVLYGPLCACRVFAHGGTDT